jgi:hypothetical protein
MGIGLKNKKREAFVKTIRSIRKKKPFGSKQKINEIKSKLRPLIKDLNPKIQKNIEIQAIDLFSKNYILFKKKNNRNPDDLEIKKLITNTLAKIYLDLNIKKRSVLKNEPQRHRYYL